jgi:uncharacterized membrane protein
VIIRGTTAAVVIAALGLSLAANVFLGGYMMAQATRDGPMPALDRGILLGGHGYPPPIRSALKAEMQANRADIRDRLRDLRRARRESFEAMRADPFDASRLATALAAERAAVTRLQEGGHAVLERVIAAAPAAERAEIERVRKGEERRREGRGPRDGRGGGEGEPGGGDAPPDGDASTGNDGDAADAPAPAN